MNYYREMEELNEVPGFRNLIWVTEKLAEIRGVKLALRETILLLGRRKFGPMSFALEKHLQELDDYGLLWDIVAAFSDAKTWQDLPSCCRAPQPSPSNPSP